MLLTLPPPIHHLPSSAKVDLSLIIKPDNEEGPPPQVQQQQPLSVSSVSPVSSRPSMLASEGPPPPPASRVFPGSTYTPSAMTTPTPADPHAPTHAGSKRHSTSSLGSEPPAKKQSKWSPEEDALIIDLRGKGMKWEDISKKLPGRSAISCRLHYQNYLERRAEWDEDRKNKLARLYERFKAEMWAKVAEEMAIPWRAAEAMHWQLGEQEMAKRAGVVPFSLSSSASASTGASASIETPPKLRRNTTTVMPRLRRQSMSVASASQRSISQHQLHQPPPTPPYPMTMSQGMTQGMSLPGFSPSQLPPAHPQHSTVHPPPTLPQPLPQSQSQGQPQLPSVEEMTAGVPAHSSSHTQSIVNPYHPQYHSQHQHRHRHHHHHPHAPPPLNLPPHPHPHPHPQSSSDIPGLSPTSIPRTRP